MPGPPEELSEGSRTYFRLRNCETLVSNPILTLRRRCCVAKTHQKESIRHKGICEHRPPNPSRPTSALILAHREDRAQPYCRDDADKLVAGVGDEIIDLGFGGDVQEVAAKPEHDELEEDDDGGIGEGQAEELWFEFAVHARDERGEEDVCHKGHGGDVHVWNNEQGP